MQISNSFCHRYCIYKSRILTQKSIIYINIGLISLKKGKPDSLSHECECIFNYNTEVSLHHKQKGEQKQHT